MITTLFFIVPFFLAFLGVACIAYALGNYVGYGQGLKEAGKFLQPKTDRESIVSEVKKILTANTPDL